MVEYNGQLRQGNAAPRSSVVGANPSPAGPGASRPPQKILLVRPRYIGDVLLSTPLIRALRDALPDAQLDYLTSAPCADLLRGNPHLDHLLAYPVHGKPWTYAQAIRNMLRAQYDVVIDLEGARVTARLTRLSQAPLRIGYNAPTPRWAYTHTVPEPDNRAYWVHAQAQLLRPLGIEVASLRTELFLNEWDRSRGGRILNRIGLSVGESFVALTPGSAHVYNRWPAERFAAVADHLSVYWGIQVVLLFGPGQQPVVRAVQEAVRRPGQCRIAVTPTIREAAAVLERSSMYIGTDTGTRHLAIALGVPTIGVFGRQYPERWTPPHAPEHRTVAHDPGCKDRCRHRSCAHLACINEIPVSAVVREVDAMLTKMGQSRSHNAVSANPSSPMGNPRALPGRP